MSRFSKAHTDSQKKTEMKLTSARQIWKTKITPTDFREAIEYATISLPWTFDRMHYGPRKQNAVNNRLWHIMSGVLNQTLLERELKSRGYRCELDWSHYRLSDIFDFRIGDKIYDVKTASIFSEYSESLGRERFTPELLIRGRSYPGPEWKRFFPMMVPMTQLNVEHMKNGYIFGYAVMPYDQRKLTPERSDNGFWCAAPYGDAHTFFHKTTLITLREEASSGFIPTVEWIQYQSTLESGDIKIKITFFGEWAGNRKTEVVTLDPGQGVSLTSEMSSLSCVKLDHPAGLAPSDVVRIRVKNKFKKKVPDFVDPSRNLNNDRFVWELGRESFVNLRVPDDYVMYWIGHIPMQEFAQGFLAYPCYFIPHPKNMDENALGRLSTDFKQGLESYDKRREKALSKGVKTPWPELAPLIRGRSIRAGIMIAATMGGRSIGAACYAYPPYALSESALYVLPQDLYSMDSL